MDRLITEFDRALRTLAGVVQAHRPTPAGANNDASLSPSDRAHSAALMRVNHCGEVCAQALYQGQALASRNDALVDSLRRAADEENDHLDWTARRVDELGGRTSVLNPLWYAGALALGYAAGRAGDRWNLAFLAETERQVEGHLHSHLERLSPHDTLTRAIVEQMKTDERAHADMAVGLGAAVMPDAIKSLMRGVSKVMTTLSYRI